MKATSAEAAVMELLLLALLLGVDVEVEPAPIWPEPGAASKSK
jgi:hypothetical protein